MNKEVFTVEGSDGEFQSIFPTAFASYSKMHGDAADAWAYIAETILHLAQEKKSLGPYIVLA